ncbi:hypothetical protein Ga0466249_000635 [Sporomusaceae bacterium BoRhaA]|uniref:hypothetical protein n=1 Tax=Pelorhabdus rhamnosifermentans TaxID=2772457 RepID=UPI001C0603BA|nr:hypothetical protein [Pelorhabdus rhamnosifermentans]MBU2699556.1 hypothetical protein [Pelorhabdus rhamnosifermentans]
MSVFLGLVVCELKLYLRSKSFWLMGLLIIFSAGLSTLNVLLLQFLVAKGLVRDRWTGFGRILSALPHSTPIVYLARAVANFFLLLSLWPFMLIVVGLLPDFVPADWLFSCSSVVFVTLKYVITCATSIGFVFLLGAITQRSFWLYIFIGICWILELEFASNLNYFPAWSKLVLFGHGVMLPAAPSAAVGYFPQQELLGNFATTQLAMAALFFVISVMMQMIRRGESIRRSKFVIAILLVAVACGLGAGCVVWQELDGRERDFRLALQESLDSATVISTQGAIAPNLEAYHLEVQLQTKDHQLAGTAHLKLNVTDTSAGPLVFTLRNCFQVSEVTVDGQAEGVEWWREGSRLLVRLPEHYRQEKSFTLNVSYSGRVWEWFDDRLARPTGPVNLIAADFSLLRSGYAWYPIPGDQPLYQRKFYTAPGNDLKNSLFYTALSNDSIKNTLWAKTARHDAVPFQLTVDIDTDSTVGANLEQVGQEWLKGSYKQRYYFESPMGKDIFLFAGPYHYEKKTIPGQRDSVAVYNYPRHQGNVDQVLTSLAKPYQFVENLIQPARNLTDDDAAPLYTLVELPPCFFCTDDGTPVKSLTLTNAIALSENLFRKDVWHLDFLDGIRTNKLAIAVLQRWWQADITGIDDSRHGDITESLMLYLYALYVDKNQQPGFYDQVKQNLLTGERTGNGEGDFIRPDMIGGDVVRDVFLTLDDIRNTQQGESEFQAMMQRFYELTAKTGTVNPDDFAQSVEAVLVKGNASAEQTANIRQRLASITQQVNEDVMRQLNAEPSLALFVFNLEDWLP